jgi:hypothetical protein
MMFKHKLAFASLLVLSGCGVSREAMMALEEMQILENNTKPGLSYTSVSGSGNDVTLKGVELKAPADYMVAIAGLGTDLGPDGGEAAGLPDPNAPPAVVARAESMTFKGLTMKDGKPTVRDIRLNNITPTIPLGDVTLTFGTLSLDGMNEATGTFIAGAIGMDEALTPPPYEQWAFRKAEIGGIKLAGMIPQDEGEAGDFAVELGELSLGDFTSTKLGEAKLAGLKGALNVPGMVAIAGTFDFGALTVSDINTGFLGKAFMAGLASGMNPEEKVDFTEIYRDFTSPLDGGVDRVDWTGMAANVSGLKFDTSEMHAKVTRNADGVAIASDLPRFSMKMTADASGGTVGAMGMMMLAMAGYESDVIEVYSGASASFDPAKDLTRWTDYNIGVTDMFDVKMSGGVIGLKQALPSLMSGIMSIADMAGDQIEADAAEDEEAGADEDDSADDGAEDAAPEADADADEEAGGDMFGDVPPEMIMSLVMGVLPLQLTDLDIAITDTELMNFILESQAAEAGQDVAAFRADLVTMIAASSVFLTDAGVDAAIASELTAAASAFMAGPGTLRIQLKPKTPLGVMSAMATPLTKDNLGFTASFTPAAPAVN